ncbi:PA2169 family four-helix-bundle protein [Pedobacter sp.]|uniref:PA2169 family four-helix-bundle protein n=1 Tax=Pedobacter sp. TaxID=1411316 RepID=UPI003D7FC759
MTVVLVHQIYIIMGNSTANAEILNDLIQINNDRIEGYEKAIKELEPADSDLKALFVKMIGESHKHKLALATEVQALGSDIEKGTTGSGKIYRAWMDVKAVFTGHDRKTILNNCEFGEDAAQKAYKTALEQEDLSANLRELISEQKAELRASHDQIKGLRDLQAS